MGGLQLAMFKFGLELSPGPVLFAMDRYVMWHFPVPQGGLPSSPFRGPPLCCLFLPLPQRLLASPYTLLGIFISRLVTAHTTRSVPDLRSKNSHY